MSNIDQAEISKFNERADQWWDKQGEFRTLHQINPLRLQFIEQHTSLTGKQILDIGCGGGILTESLSLRGAKATGIDLSETAIACAKDHAQDNQLTIDYRLTSAETMAQTNRQKFDVVVCMELLEHVPDPNSLIQACSDLVKPGGHVFLSTINRNPKAYLLTVVAAEYLMKLLPRGTHDYQKFIKPAELETMGRQAGLSTKAFRGMSYSPLTKQFRLSDDISMNYLVCCQK